MKITTSRLALRLSLPKRNFGRGFDRTVEHELTEEQIEKIREAIGDGSDWPRHTDNPQVNYAVDCLVSYEDKPPLYSKVEKTYVEEISAMAAIS